MRMVSRRMRRILTPVQKCLYEKLSSFERARSIELGMHFTARISVRCVYFTRFRDDIFDNPFLVYRLKHAWIESWVTDTDKRYFSFRFKLGVFSDNQQRYPVPYMEFPTEEEAKNGMKGRVAYRWRPKYTVTVHFCVMSDEFGGAARDWKHLPALHYPWRDSTNSGGALDPAEFREETFLATAIQYWGPNNTGLRRHGMSVNCFKTVTISLLFV